MSGVRTQTAGEDRGAGRAYCRGYARAESTSIRLGKRAWGVLGFRAGNWDC